MTKSRRQRVKTHRSDRERAYERRRADTSQLDVATGLLRELLQGPWWPANASGLAASLAAIPPPVQRGAIATVSIDVIEAVFDRGWTPHDLSEYLHRHGVGVSARLTMALVAARTATYPADRVHPKWIAQLAGVEAGDPRADDVLLLADVRSHIATLFQLARLPSMARVLPRPGAVASAPAGPDTVDHKMLTRIRALLAKAESTKFEAEAEALTAKAQELMTRYSIDHAPADGAPETDAPDVRRLWIDNPYVVPKSVLVGEVARANRCRTVVHDRMGYVIVMGFEADLDVVELLVTSLLVQATRAMQDAGSRVNRYGESRTKSFRRSFLLAYAHRIGERLRESADGVVAVADERRGGALVPVLKTRTDAVDAAFQAVFPSLTTLATSVGNREGYGAGRAAADHARLDVRRSVPGHSRSA